MIEKVGILIGIILNILSNLKVYDNKKEKDPIEIVEDFFNTPKIKIRN